MCRYKEVGINKYTETYQSFFTEQKLNYADENGESEPKCEAVKLEQYAERQALTAEQVDISVA